MSKKHLIFLTAFCSFLSLLIFLGYQEVNSNVRRATPTPLLGGATLESVPGNDEVLEGLIPTPSKRTDLAPDALEEEKIPVVVRHLDGSYELVLFPPGSSQVTILKRFLPTDSIVAIGPASSLMGHNSPNPSEIATPDLGRPISPPPLLDHKPTIQPPASPTPLQ